MPKLMRCRLFDAAGVEIEAFEGDPALVAGIVAQFVLLQGTDPDENGAGATGGRIEFEPVKQVEEAPCTVGR